MIGPGLTPREQAAINAALDGIARRERHDKFFRAHGYYPTVTGYLGRLAGVFSQSFTASFALERSRGKAEAKARRAEPWRRIYRTIYFLWLCGALGAYLALDEDPALSKHPYLKMGIAAVWPGMIVAGTVYRRFGDDTEEKPRAIADGVSL